MNFDAADPGWTFVSPGRGGVDVDALIRTLNRIGYEAPLSVEWEGAEMDREWGAREAVEFVRRTDFTRTRSQAMFDRAFRS